MLPRVIDAIAKHSVPPGQLTLHADRGGPMRAKTTALLLADLGVTKSHSRPHTSNDNPFSESHFVEWQMRQKLKPILFAYARDSFVAGASLCGVAEDYPQRIEWSDAASHAAWRSALFANDLEQHALAAPPVELAIKNLLPRTEVEFTRRDRDHNLPPHNLAFHMGIGIVLAGSVVTVA
jgi:transposase InsO family protein